MPSEKKTAAIREIILNYSEFSCYRNTAICRKCGTEFIMHEPEKSLHLHAPDCPLCVAFEEEK
jgi:hypothetical protein